MFAILQTGPKLSYPLWATHDGRFETFTSAQSGGPGELLSHATEAEAEKAATILRNRDRDGCEFTVLDQAAIDAHVEMYLRKWDELKARRSA